MARLYLIVVLVLKLGVYSLHLRISCSSRLNLGLLGLLHVVFGLRRDSSSWQLDSLSVTSEFYYEF